MKKTKRRDISVSRNRGSNKGTTNKNIKSNAI